MANVPPQAPVAQRLSILRAALKRAEDNLLTIRQSDDFCYTNGAYDAAERVVHTYRQEVAAVEREQQTAGAS